jgi:hypothetical protein
VASHRPLRPLPLLGRPSLQGRSLHSHGLHTFSSFGNNWTCVCGLAVEDDDVAHALGYNWLSALVRSRNGSTANVRRDFDGNLGFSPSNEGQYSRLAPLTLKRPQAHWDFHCNLRPGPGHVLANFSFIHPLAASYLGAVAGTPGHAVILRDADKHSDYYAHHACPGYAFRAISFETLGRFSPSAMQFLCSVTRAAFPHPGHHAGQRAACFANAYRQLSVVQCRHLYRTLTATAGIHTTRTGLGWIYGVPHASPNVLH